ncbi:hypothetical protein KR222_000847 [Zaprionus bogoriensis]|nr:hypothetical protein KR222_000847 [Zaprionus bogoriensis]
MNTPRIRQQLNAHPHLRRVHPELHWWANDGQLEPQAHHQYERFMPPLVAARLQNEHPLDVAQFIQNLRINLQRQRSHYDMGEGDGVHVWSWRLLPGANDRDGGGDDVRTPQHVPHVGRQPQLLGRTN